MIYLQMLNQVKFGKTQMFKKMFHKHEFTTFSCTLEDLGCPEIKEGFYRYNWGVEQTYPKKALVIYKVCYCGSYNIEISDGAKEYKINENYILAKIKEIKKSKDDKETERLLNFGNPEYEAISKRDKEIEGLKQLIEQLRTQIHIYQEQLKKSVRNDAIWEKMTETEKRKLAKKYDFKLEEIR